MNLSALFMMKDNPKKEISDERVDAEYAAEIQKCFESPPQPCDKRQALKLLKRFSGKRFSDFWLNSVSEYLPAVSEGIMKLEEKLYTHDEAVQYAKALISDLDPKDLARDFLYGVAHNAPEYRTALACYYYVKNLPDHEFAKMFIGRTAKGDFYSDTTCEICGYNSESKDEPKMKFWHVNNMMNRFYHNAEIPHCIRLNDAILFLEEYKKLPEPDTSADDLEFFENIIAFIEALPENTPPSKLRKELKQSALLKMTVRQIDSFIDMLGYLNILHTEDSFGVTVCHTNERDMPDPINTWSDYAHPVNKWTRKCGIDHDMIHSLFNDLY